MANYVPVFVENELDLHCAIKNNTAVIVTKDRDLFAELDKKVTYSKGKRVLGNIGIGVGAAIGTFLTLGVGAAIAGGSALGKYLGDKLRDYNYVVDYTEKRVILLRKHNPHKFNENTDTIEGIDLNAIAIQNS